MTQVSRDEVRMRQTPITLATEEVRMATTMTGGVSLAIWMGGVAREIDLLRQASQWRRRLGSSPGAGAQPRGALSSANFADRNCYARLLEVLDAVVEVDVLSGTSAGGINAVLLAYVRARNGSLDKLRESGLTLARCSTCCVTPPTPMSRLCSTATGACSANCTTSFPI